MIKISRRALVLAMGIAPLTSSAFARNRTDSWLHRQTHPLRSIDPADESWDDLAPLADAIGTARVVQLGEPGHGAGAAFAARSRIIKFLHQRLGFDVVIWESGFYDMTLTQAALRDGEDPVTAGQRGLFPFWANAKEVRPLLEYASHTQTGSRTLEMAGYDMQVTARGSRDRFAEELRAFVSGFGEKSALSDAAEEALVARSHLCSTGFSAEADLITVERAGASVLRHIGEVRSSLELAHGRLTVGFMERALMNMQLDARAKFESRRSDGPIVASENRRDAANADNLRWLLDVKYPGRKVVIWAHNAHVMNAYYGPSFRNIFTEPETDRMKPTGVFLTDWLGNNVYTIGITAYGGEDGWADRTGEPTAIKPAEPDSLEAQLHRLGHSWLFVDLRAAEQAPGHPLHGTMRARLPKYDTVEIDNIGRIYDGLLFIDKMTPATPVER